MQMTELHPRRGLIGVEGQSPLEILARLIGLSQPNVGETEAVMDLGRLSVEGQGPFAIGLAHFGALSTHLEKPEIDERTPMLGLGLEQFAVETTGFVERTPTLRVEGAGKR